MQKCHRAPKHILFGLKSEKAGNRVPNFDFFEKDFKLTHEMSVQNGSDAFPNELTRFRFEAKPIWDKIQQQCNKCRHNLNMALTFYFKKN